MGSYSTKKYPDRNCLQITASPDCNEADFKEMVSEAKQAREDGFTNVLLYMRINGDLVCFAFMIDHLRPERIKKAIYRFETRIK
jgi:hypothetical protein